MKYLILIHSNEKYRELWETLSPAEQRELGPGHRRLWQEMVDAGVHVSSEGLADPSLATWVSVQNDKTIASDGPFAEVKEHLAGFYLIDVEDLEQAVAWAAKVPDAAHTQVEVRPVLDMSGWEF
jgi:hypothetical protein